MADKLSEETLQPCWVCGKVWQRKDSSQYAFFQNMLCCESHHGTALWMQGALALSYERMEIEEKKSEEERQK